MSDKNPVIFRKILDTTSFLPLFGGELFELLVHLAFGKGSFFVSEVLVDLARDIRGGVAEDGLHCLFVDIRFKADGGKAVPELVRCHRVFSFSINEADAFTVFLLFGRVQARALAYICRAPCRPQSQAR